jgi:hypothetical protein
MEKFTHGIIVVHPEMANDEGVPVVHFVGYWDEPTKADVESLMNEIETDEEFGLTELARDNKLEYYPAPEDILEYYNSLNYEED